MSKRPPPYFPQGSLNPSSESRYRKFKLAIAAAIIVAILVFSGIGFGIYYLISRFI